MKASLKIVAGVGLALGGIFGMAGTMVANQNLRVAFWALDAVGLVVATSLLALMFFRKGNDCVAAGFLVFAIGEAVMLGGTAQKLCRECPFVRRRHCALVRRTFTYQRAKGICDCNTHRRAYQCNSLCDYVGRNLLGRAAASNLQTASILWLPVRRAHIHWLDLGASEGRLKSIAANTPLIST